MDDLGGIAKQLEKIWAQVHFAMSTFKNVELCSKPRKRMTKAQNSKMQSVFSSGVCMWTIQLLMQLSGELQNLSPFPDPMR